MKSYTLLSRLIKYNNTNSSVLPISHPLYTLQRYPLTFLTTSQVAETEFQLDPSEDVNADLIRYQKLSRPSLLHSDLSAVDTPLTLISLNANFLTTPGLTQSLVNKIDKDIFGCIVNADQMDLKEEILRPILYRLGTLDLTREVQTAVGLLIYK